MMKTRDGPENEVKNEVKASDVETFHWKAILLNQTTGISGRRIENSSTTLDWRGRSVFSGETFLAKRFSEVDSIKLEKLFKNSNLKYELDRHQLPTIHLQFQDFKVLEFEIQILNFKTNLKC